MKTAPVPVESWGRYHKTSSVVRAADVDTLACNGRTVLPCGNRLSYGDSCLNDEGELLQTDNLDCLLSFDGERGTITAQSGLTLGEILEYIVPRGWFLPVTPGTKFVTLGGAIANDVHGKNHHVAGSFGNFVEEFALLRANGDHLICSPTQNADMFRATIGGLGLTGLVLWARFQLKKIQSAFLDVEMVRFGSLSEFFEVNQDSIEWPYTVAWVDCIKRNRKGQVLGRGLFVRGRFAETDDELTVHRPEPRAGIPLDAPEFLLNRASVGLFNTLLFHRQWRKTRRFRQHYDPFFYPLDSIGGWNRLYGKRGFFQFQCVVPPAEQSAIQAVLDAAADAGLAPFLSVLKTFGDRPAIRPFAS